LIKFLDAQDWLSVQVHPDDKLAAELEGQPRGKTECWYVVDANPGAQIVYGFDQAIDAEGFRKALDIGRAKEVLQYITVSPGDFIYVPAGTMHALGPGLLIYELQQTSDTTYRVYDWDRLGLDGKPRDLHIEKSLRVAKYDVKPQAKIEYQRKPVTASLDKAVLVNGPYFKLEKAWLRHSADPQDKLHIAPDNQIGHPCPLIVTVIDGEATIAADNSKQNFAPVTLRLGQSAFIPAALSCDISATNAAQLLLASPVEA
jgi:mannose-6-phosphate isomerase